MTDTRYERIYRVLGIVMIYIIGISIGMEQSPRIGIGIVLEWSPRIGNWLSVFDKLRKS